MTRPLAAGPASDTIFAPATAQGRGAITIIRLSGSATAGVLRSLAGSLPTPRQATLRSLRDRTGQLMDRSVVLWMPAPASYTGEDCAELHLHGGRAVLQAVTSALVQAGLRPADPGEFTLRAHLNGKLDLLEAEAIGSLADAETEAQRVHALRQLSGEQSAVMAGWAVHLTRALAWQEALIDFADETIPPETELELTSSLTRMMAEMNTHLAGAARALRLQRGLVFVLAGAPNAGKSSLLNALAGYDAAIVSPTPGTTRDPVTVELVLAGIPVTMTDTAGLRATTDALETEGARRARSKMHAADLVIEVIDAMTGESTGVEAGLRVTNKCDAAPPRPGTLAVSALTQAGLAELSARLTKEAAQLANPGGPVLANARHAASLRDALAAIEASLISTLPELRAEELRIALNAIGRITGAVTSEDVLSVVFGAFCIGK